MTHSRISSHFLATIFFSILFFLVLSPTTVVRAEEGPGLGNREYPSTGQIGRITSPRYGSNKPQGEGAVMMHHGYLAVIFAPDSGQKNGGISFYDMTDPRTPVRIFSTPANTSSPAVDVREPHGFGFSDSYGRSGLTDPNPGHFAVVQAQRGIQFWDFTNHRAPVRLRDFPLPPITGTDYSDGAWWAFWQAPYVYVGGSGTGLHIVDATDPRNPRIVRRIENGSGTPIRGFRKGPVFAIGNLLVMSGNDVSGYITLDISDPGNPQFLSSITGVVAYSSLVNGNRIIAAGSADSNPELAVYQISNAGIINPTPIRRIVLGPNTGPGDPDKGGYVSVQDNFAHVGASRSYQKIDIDANPAVRRFRVNAAPPPADLDWDFAQVLGNVVLVGNDHGTGSPIIAHDTAPDTVSPVVNMVNPPDGATGQRVTSRVGITLSDAIDIKHINSNSFIVRKEGTTTPLPGKYSTQFGIVNFWPNQPLESGTRYEVVVPSGTDTPNAMKDYAGNLVRARFTSTFTTAGTVPGISCTLATPRAAAAIDTPVSFSPASTTGSGLTYLWDFGDGSTATTRDATHTYRAIGRYTVRLTVDNPSSPEASCTAGQTIFVAPTVVQPRASSTIAYDGPRNKVWVVNSDNNSVTAINNASPPTKIGEFNVGRNPQTLAHAPDAAGSIWVTNMNSDTISVLNGDTGAVTRTISLPRGSRPFGVAFSPNNIGYVTLQGTGRLLRFDPNTFQRLAPVDGIDVGPWARGIAISGDSSRIYVTRFISPPATVTPTDPNEHGEVMEVNASTFQVRTIRLAMETLADTEKNGRGVPNYISTITISPDGQRAWVPSKKDNTLRGERRDGQPLTFESTVRTIVSQIDLGSGTEALPKLDINDRDLANAVALTPHGDYAFISTQGTNTVELLDVYSGELAGAVNNGTNLGPRGLLLITSAAAPNNKRLYVQNFISRTVSVFDVTGIVDSTSTASSKIGSDIAAVALANELLPTQVLRGKRVFYNAADPRMSKDSYISCASCHQDGGQDGRVLDFSDRGEGFRNTVELNGRSGMGHGRVHWSGNFNEMQDFENDIRLAFLGTGFMSQANFDASRDPLGPAKAGRSAALDDLAAFVASMTSVGASPFRNPDGTMTADALEGQRIFGDPTHPAFAGCASCHIPNRGFTDSVVNSDVRHNVGTIQANSGDRRKGFPDAEIPIAKIDTPTLIGVWQTAPYLHNGAAPTLRAVIDNNPGNVHGTTSHLSDLQRNQLVAYMQQIEASEGTSSVCVNATSNAAWHNNAFANQTGTFTAEFDATPSGLINGVVGLSNGSQTAYTGLAGIVRFNSTAPGFIDARNGGAYQAATSIPYTGGTKYHFRLVVDVAAKRYSVFMTPPGQSELVVGQNFAFRSEQASVTQLNNWAVTVAASPAGSLNVCDFSVESGGGGGPENHWIEAESGSISPPMGTVSDIAASAGAAIEVATGNNSGTAPPASGIASYSVTVAQPGNYKLWGRVRAPANTDDSFWVRVNGGTWARWNGLPLGTTYQWDDVHSDTVAGSPPIVYNLPTGATTVEIAYREDGARLDKLLLTNDLTFVPTGTGN